MDEEQAVGPAGGRARHSGDSVSPLAGIRVLTLAEQYPGPFATLILADLGADVILVERPDGGDPSRRFPGFFEALNRNKRSVALDLKSQAGLDACLRLVETSDVFLEGFRPGVLERLGLGYDALTSRKPGLVYVSISGFGQLGPYSGHPAHDLSYQGFAGHLDPSRREWLPDAPGLALGDLISGLYAVIATLAGLADRSTAKKGFHADVAVVDSLISLLTSELVPVINSTGPPGFPIEPGYGVFKTADGQNLTLSIVHEDRFWDSMCVILGLEELKGMSHEQRLDGADEIRARIADRIKTRSASEWLGELLSAGVPSGPVLSHPDLVDHPHVTFRRLVVDGPQGKRYVRQPLLLGGHFRDIALPCPALGEHTESIMRELGLSDSEVDLILAMAE